MSDRTSELVRRVKQDPFFLGHALDEYVRSEDSDERGLATLLGCPTETLNALALCRRPRSMAPHFWADIERIAARFQVRGEALAEIVRRADALTLLRRAAEGERGLLMAARDREKVAPLSADAGEPKP